MQRFISELQRRNVLRVAAFYAGGGWLLVQVATQVFPFYDLPPWTVRLVISAVLIGFPFALLFSWFYELTPEGLKLESEVDRSQSVARETGKKLDRWIIAVLGLAVVLLLANQLVTRKPAAPVAELAATAVEKSIAVLPFENRSSDKENAYFADGIQDEILTRLAKIAALKVISRTSTQHYASSPDNLPVIAKQLGVANILEGSVQKVGDQVRITVQLIEASTDTHLWAETYDRKLIDIFGVESEVAKAIADALQAKLSGAEKQELAQKPTEHVEAYDAYLRGLANESRFWYEPEALEVAVGLYRQATQLDPHFVAAWARLSRANALTYFRLADTSPARREAARKAMDKAIELQPDSTDALLAQAWYRYLIERDYPVAKQMFQALESRLPGSSEVPRALSSIVRRQGLWAESLAYSDKAIALDPRDPLLLTDRTYLFKVTRRFSEALKTLDRRLELLPGDPDTLEEQVRIYQSLGDLDKARQLLARVPTERGDGAFQSLLERDYEKAIQILNLQLEKPEIAESPYGSSVRAYLAWTQALAGDLAASKANSLRARREFELLRKKEPDNAEYPAELAFVYALLGEKKRALEESERAMALMPTSRDAIWGAGFEESMASVEAQVGEPGRAIDRLRRLLVTNYGGGGGVPITVAMLKLDPVWDPLRKDPRFQALIGEDNRTKY